MVHFNFICYFKQCGPSAKDRGATENPVSDLELNLSKTATKAIKFYWIKWCPLVSNKWCKMCVFTHLQIRNRLPLLHFCSNLVPNHAINVPWSLPTVCIVNLRIKCVTENQKCLFCFTNLKSTFLHDSHIWLWGFFTLLDALAHGAPRLARWPNVYKVWQITVSYGQVPECLSN